MAKPFLSKKEIDTILEAYSKNFKYEFKKAGPYTFGTTYLYVINMCPEIDDKGEKTGRILVNHYSHPDRAPFFVDVWEREDGELMFRSRNLPDKDLLSAEEKIKALEEELEGYKSVGIESKSKVKIKEFEKRLKITEDLYNSVVIRLHAERVERDTFFRTSTTYYELLKERDAALLEKADAEARADSLEKKLKETTESYLQLAKSTDIPDVSDCEDNNIDDKNIITILQSYSMGMGSAWHKRKGDTYCHNGTKIYIKIEKDEDGYFATRTDCEGLITYKDYWRFRDDKLILQYSQNVKNPYPDEDFIQEVMAENDTYRKDYYNSQSKIDDLQFALRIRDRKINDYLIEIEEYKEQIKNYKSKNKSLEKRLTNFTSEPVHNARGAGRKKDPDVEKKIEQVQEMIKAGKSREEIMEEMGIGMSTYYRYAKGNEKRE